MIYVESCLIRGLDQYVARSRELTPGDLLITHSGISIMLGRKADAFSFTALSRDLRIERIATIWLRAARPVIKQLRSRKFGR